MVNGFANLSEGRFIAVVGPSGAGKDSVLDGARAYLSDSQQPGQKIAPRPTHFVKRWITRPADAGGEEHYAVTEEQFRCNLDSGGFLLQWAAHGLFYGIPKDVLDLLKAGENVVANLSRSVLDDLRALPCRHLIIEITASSEIRAERLAGRGRENLEEIQRRLDRKMDDVPPASDVVKILNEGPLEKAVMQFVSAVRDI